jgi:hypothetical protein
MRWNDYSVVHASVCRDVLLSLGRVRCVPPLSEVHSRAGPQVLAPTYASPSLMDVQLPVLIPMPPSPKGDDMADPYTAVAGLLRVGTCGV